MVVKCFVSSQHPMYIVLNGRMATAMSFGVVVTLKRTESNLENVWESSQSSMHLIIFDASLFPLFAASEINDFARSTFCFIPRPSAQHSASIIMASASPRVTHSSRSETAFSLFFSISFPSIILFASSLFASISPCGTFPSVIVCVSLLCSVICETILVLLFFSKREKRERIQSEKSLVLFCCFLKRS